MENGEDVIAKPISSFIPDTHISSLGLMPFIICTHLIHQYSWRGNTLVHNGTHLENLSAVCWKMLTALKYWHNKLQFLYLQKVQVKSKPHTFQVLFPTTSHQNPLATDLLNCSFFASTFVGLNITNCIVVMATLSTPSWCNYYFWNAM